MFYPCTYDRGYTDGHSSSGTDDHVMSNARFYPRTYDSDDTDSSSNRATDSRDEQCQVLTPYLRQWWYRRSQ